MTIKINIKGTENKCFYCGVETEKHHVISIQGELFGFSICEKRECYVRFYKEYLFNYLKQINHITTKELIE